MLGPEHFTKRAGELENKAKHEGDTLIGASYLELANAFRKMANVVSLARTADDDQMVKLAESMIGKTSVPTSRA